MSRSSLFVALLHAPRVVLAGVAAMIIATSAQAQLPVARLSTVFPAGGKAGASFDLKKYNDTVISFGSPPVKYVRELMGL